VNRTVEERLLNPKPGSAIAAARDFGIDLTLLVENLRKSPAERLRSNDQAANDLLRFEASLRKSRELNRPSRK
jgi:hypothetical protein